MKVIFKYQVAVILVFNSNRYFNGKKRKKLKYKIYMIDNWKK